MQIPYKIESLAAYRDMVRSKNIPDFKERCLICNGKNCAVFNGTYPRNANDPFAKFSQVDFEILQYRCYQKGEKPVTSHVTFTLIPWMLIPYHRLPISFIIFAIQLKINDKLSYVKLLNALDTIFMNYAEEFNYSFFLNISTLLYWNSLIIDALIKFQKSTVGMSMVPNHLYQNFLSDDRTERINHFINYLQSYQSQYNNQPIEGPVAFAWEFYQKSGGVKKNAFFLFGTASQHKS